MLLVEEPAAADAALSPSEACSEPRLSAATTTAAGFAGDACFCSITAAATEAATAALLAAAEELLLPPTTTVAEESGLRAMRARARSRGMRTHLDSSTLLYFSASNSDSRRVTLDAVGKMRLNGPRRSC